MKMTIKRIISVFITLISVVAIINDPNDSLAYIPSSWLF